jgi:putative flavoprotein involved in K+ transport
VPFEQFETRIIGEGQPGLAMSKQLLRRGVDHPVEERPRKVEHCPSEGWEGLRANASGPSEPANHFAMVW